MASTIHHTIPGENERKIAAYLKSGRYNCYDQQILTDFLAGKEDETPFTSGICLLDNPEVRMAYMYVHLPERSLLPDAISPELGNALNGKRTLYEAYVISTFLRDTPKSPDECDKILTAVKHLAAENRCTVRRAPALTADDLKNALELTGAKRDDKVVVHSAYASLGGVAGGPAAAAQALIDYFGTDGVLMMPSFDFPYYLGKNDDNCFDLRTTPSCVGAITDEFRKHPGVLRSLNPSHSIAVYGEKNFHWIKDHHKTLTMGKDSPLGKLEEENGYALMINCPDSVTFMHVVETSCRVHCLGYRNEEYRTRLPDGTLQKIRTWGWRNGECPAYDRQKIFDFLRANGLIREIMVRRSLWQFFKLADYRKAYEKVVIHGKNGCISCPLAPRTTTANVPTDWDEENSRVKPDTTAFTGDWQY